MEITKYKLETQMHSLQANASPVGCSFAAKCRRSSRLPYSGCCL